MKHIYDPSFRYTPSHETNVRATFERLRCGGLRNAGKADDTLQRSGDIKLARAGNTVARATPPHLTERIES